MKNGGGRKTPSARWWQKPEVALARFLMRKLDVGVRDNVVFRCSGCHRLRSGRVFGCKVCGARKMHQTTVRTHELLFVYLTGR